MSSQPKLTLRDTRAALDAIDAALGALGEIPPVAMSGVEAIIAAPEKEDGRLTAHLRRLEEAAVS